MTLRFKPAYIFLIIALGVFLYFSYLWIFRVSILEKSFSTQLNLKVKAEDVVLGFRKLIITNLAFKNPRQTAITNILEIPKMEIDIHPWQLFKKKKTIDRIQIMGPTIFTEFYTKDGDESNWSHIFDILNNKDDRLYDIQNLSLLNVTFITRNFFGQTVPIWPIPYLETTAFDVGKGLSLSVIFKLVISDVFSKGISQTNLAPFLKGLSPVPSTFSSE